jgi:hypothetical protein
MPNYEKEVISIPAADSYNLLIRHKIHAHPDTSGFPYKTAKYYTFRKRGGVMQYVFECDDIFNLRPYTNDYESIKNPEIRTRLKNYIRDRFRDYEFAEKNADYKFYLLRKAHDLPHEPKLPRQRNHTYFHLIDLPSGEKYPEPDRG